MTLPFQAIAFDMDGTFAHDDKSYDKARFERILYQLRDRNVHVIVASGDQYENLRQYFPETFRHLTFVTENGAYVVEDDQALMTKTIEPSVVRSLIPFMVDELHLIPLMVGTKAGYLSRQMSPEMMKVMKFYFPKHSLVDNFDVLPDDRFFQISFTVNDEAETRRLLAAIQNRFGNRLAATPSGNGSVDLTVPGVDKAFALRFLLKKWKMSAAKLLAFGDGGNDVTMLKLAGISWAMPNGGQPAKQAAGQVAPKDNNHDGVLDLLEAYLQKKM